MQKLGGKKIGCWAWLLGILLIAIAIIFGGGKLYTDAIVRASEAKYPPVDFVTVEGIQLHYLKTGSGRPVVILHGSGGKLQDFVFSPLFDLLKNKYQVIIFDRPGLGYSQKPDNEEATPAMQARLLHGAIDKLGVKKPLLVGQSWGGVMALAYAQDYPDDVAGLVLLGTSPYPRERQTAFFDKIALMPGVGDLILQTLYIPIGRHWVAPAILEQNKDNFSPLEAVPKNYYDVTLELGLRPRHLKASAEEKVIIPPHLPEVANRLDQVYHPVMIVAGEQDEHAMEAAPRLHQDLTLTRIKVVQGANHFLWFAYPEDVAEAVQEVWNWTEELDISK